mgnify:CR=1 FL=1
MQKLAGISLVVKDYDEAIHFYTRVLNFELLEDSKMDEDKRWVMIKPKGEGGCNIVLAQAKNEQELAAVGQQGGGRVWLFLQTDDFDRDYEIYKNNGLIFLETPRDEPYGKVAVFQDIYGNKWDLIQHKWWS